MHHQEVQFRQRRYINSAQAFAKAPQGHFHGDFIVYNLEDIRRQVDENSGTEIGWLYKHP